MDTVTESGNIQRQPEKVHDLNKIVSAELNNTSGKF